MSRGLDKQDKFCVTIFVFGALLVMLNQTSLSSALPIIMEQMQVSASTAQWLTSGYSLVEAIIIPLNAYLLGRFRSSRLFIVSMILFLVSSLLCAVSSSFMPLICGRIGQAVATGIIMPLSVTSVFLIFPRESRGLAMGLIGLVVGFAPTAGPVIASGIVDSLGWQSLFIISAVIAVLIILVAIKGLTSLSGFKRISFDAISVVLMSIGMFTLLYGMSSISSADSLLLSLGLIILGVVLIVIYVRRQFHLETPILQMRTFLVFEFRTTAIFLILMQAILIGMGVIFPLFVQNALGQSTSMSGLLMMPGVIIGACLGLIAGKLYDRYGVRGIALIGSAVLVIGAISYFFLSMDSTLLTVGLAYGLVSIGAQMLITPVNTWGMNAVHVEDVADGNAILSMVEQVGAAFGTAFLVSLSSLATTAGNETNLAVQTFIGSQYAFVGLLALAIISALIVVIFIRDSGRKKVQSEASNQEAKV